MKKVKKYWASDEHKAILNTVDSLATYIMNKKIKFAKDYVIIDAVKYNDPIYELTQEEPDVYLYVNYRIGEKRSLGIQDEVTKIDVIRLSLYKDEEEKKKKDLLDVKTKYVPILVLEYNLATFYIEKLIMHKGEIMMAFSILESGSKAYNRSWQKYLCLRKVQ